MKHFAALLVVFFVVSIKSGLAEEAHTKTTGAVSPATGAPANPKTPGQDPWTAVLDFAGKESFCMMITGGNPLLSQHCAASSDTCINNIGKALADHWVWEAQAVGSFFTRQPHSFSETGQCMKDAVEPLIQGTGKSVICNSIAFANPKMREQCLKSDASCLDKAFQMFGDLGHLGWDLTLTGVAAGKAVLNKENWDKTGKAIHENFGTEAGRAKIGKDMDYANKYATGVMAKLCEKPQLAFEIMGGMTWKFMEAMGDYSRCPQWKTVEKPLEKNQKPEDAFFSPWRQTSECAVKMGPWDCKQVVLAACSILTPIPGGAEVKHLASFLKYRAIMTKALNVSNKLKPAVFADIMNPYRLLGVEEKASKEQISTAFKELMEGLPREKAAEMGIPNDHLAAYKRALRMAYQDLTRGEEHRVKVDKWIKGGMIGMKPKFVAPEAK